ncbi:MAG: 5-(carboxyamino)imidazole ribonucleotide synthase [Pelagibacterales bacterium]|nr:5-(carboxyamino)imidazole ribonucleotide synthase [Pelagibacterales bacterium]OUU61376.1 MAG: 5-(carboxyamino)imidazole ribonucleotide synthase [Alphaproteobacteria bacterium TMED62]
MKKSIIKNITNKTLGILGGGQLGKMIAQEASRLGIRTCIYDPNKKSPAFQNANIIINDVYTNKTSLKRLIKNSDKITYEFENIPIESLNFLKKNRQIYPGLRALKYSQDRLLEKRFISNLGISVAPFYKINNFIDINKALRKLNGSAILKTRKLGYDGKGQYLIKNNKIPNIQTKIEKNKYIIEGLIKFKKEISVIVIRTKDGKLECFEPAENKHKNGILRETIFPLESSMKIKNKAKDIALKIANSLNVVGIIAVEMFINENNEIIVNEIAPRPHNSGHWTINACNISQFEALVRVIFDMPIPKIKYYHSCKMVNILGDNYGIIEKSLSIRNHIVHIYGKDEIKNSRKLGHINILS